MYQPQVDSILTVSLPDETVRARVAKIVNKNMVMVELIGAPPNHAKSHTFRKGDFVPVERESGGLLDQDRWVAVDERLLYARALPGEMPKITKPKRKPVVRAVQSDIIEKVKRSAVGR